MIQEATLIEAILGFRAQIDFLWQFFVTVHIAIFALLFIYDEAVESLNIIARIFAIAGVALFEWINGKALANTACCWMRPSTNTARSTGRQIASSRTFSGTS